MVTNILKTGYSETVQPDCAGQINGLPIVTSGKSGSIYMNPTLELGHNGSDQAHLKLTQMESKHSIF